MAHFDYDRLLSAAFLAIRWAAARARPRIVARATPCCPVWFCVVRRDAF